MRIPLGLLPGGAAGFTEDKLVGCASGGCPITSNPFIFAARGAVMGLLLSGSF